MSYIFDSYKSEIGQQFEVFGYGTGAVDFDAIVNGRDVTISLDRDEVKKLVSILEDWLNKTWS